MKFARRSDLDPQTRLWMAMAVRFRGFGDWGAALTGNGGKLRAAVEALHAELDANVRSSSPLEAINSVIREHLNACRGQTPQEALSMLAFFLNHRKATRGKYAGSSPHERLTGMPEKGSPIAQLLALAPRAAKWLSGERRQLPNGSASANTGFRRLRMQGHLPPLPCCLKKCQPPLWLFEACHSSGQIRIGGLACLSQVSVKAF